MSNQAQEQKSPEVRIIELEQTSNLYIRTNKKLADALAAAQHDLALAHAQVEMLQEMLQQTTQPQQVKSMPNRESRRRNNKNRNRNQSSQEN